MGCVARKHVFEISEEVRFIPAYLATETELEVKIKLVPRLDIILSTKQITKALIRLRGCAGWSTPLLFTDPQRQVFWPRDPYNLP